MKIKDPVIELLAIKLYEHERNGEEGTTLRALLSGPFESGWMAMQEEDREVFRAIARGETPLP